MTRGTNDPARVIEELIDDPDTGLTDEAREGLMQVHEQVISGDLTREEAFARTRELGVSDADRARAVERITQANLDEARPTITEAAESVQILSTVFEDVSDNIPELMNRLKDFSSEIGRIDRQGVEQALAEFESLVDVSGTTAEVLFRQAKILQSRLGVGFQRGAELAADIEIGAHGLVRAGGGAVGVEDARRATTAAARAQVSGEQGFAATVTAGILSLGSEQAREELQRARQIVTGEVEATPEEQAQAARLLRDPRAELQRRGIQIFESEEAERRFIALQRDAATGGVTDEVIQHHLRRGGAEDFFDNLVPFQRLQETALALRDQPGFDRVSRDVARELGLEGDLDVEGVTAVTAIADVLGSRQAMQQLEAQGVDLSVAFAALNTMLGLEGDQRITNAEQFLNVVERSGAAADIDDLRGRIGDREAAQTVVDITGVHTATMARQIKEDRQRLLEMHQKANESFDPAARSGVSAMVDLTEKIVSGEIGADEESIAEVVGAVGTALGVMQPVDESEINLSDIQKERINKAKRDLKEAKKIEDPELREKRVRQAQVGLEIAVSEVAGEVGAISPERVRQALEVTDEATGSEESKARARARSTIHERINISADESVNVSEETTESSAKSTGGKGKNTGDFTAINADQPVRIELVAPKDGLIASPGQVIEGVARGLYSLMTFTGSSNGGQQV